MSDPRVNQQSMIDTWYDRFIDNIEEGYHAEIAWNLIMMGRANASISRNIGIRFINSYKDDVIKAMLLAIANKPGDIVYTEREQNEMIVGARKLGLTWPELDIMERSLKANRKVDESDLTVMRDVDRDALSSMMADGPRYGSMPFLHTIETMRDRYSGNREIVASLDGMLEKNKDRLITDLLKVYKKDPTGRDARDMMRYLGMAGARWPELDIVRRSMGAGNAISEDVSNAFVSRMADLFYGDNPIAYREFDRKLKTRNSRDRQAVLFAVKPAIIRWMLRMIRDGAWWAASDFSGMLIAYGVEWSELDTIHKSLRAESKRIREDEEWPLVDDPPRHVLDRMQGMINDAVGQLHDAANERDENWAWEMLTKIRDMVDSNAHLDDVDLKDEDIDLTPVKDGMIKRLLMLIRAGKLRHAKSMERLMHQDWPELAAIRKSLNANKNLRETGINDKPHPIVKNVADKIKAAIDRGDNHGPGYAIQVLSRVDPKQVYDGMKHIAPDLARWFDKLADSDPNFAFEELLRISYYTVDMYPELIKALDKHKDAVLRFLLSDLKRNGPNRYVSQTVKYLSDQGLRWDELNVIRKSIDAGKPKRLGE